MSKPTRRDLYDRTGDSYEEGRYGKGHMGLYGELRNEALASIIENTFDKGRPLKILEVGCGTGLSLRYVCQLETPHNVFGMDISQTMLRQVAEKVAPLENPPNLLLASAFELPFDDASFDMIFSTRFIHQFSSEDKKKIFSEIERVTRDDGLIVMELYARLYHSIRYYLGGAKGRSREAYLSHYPSPADVRRLVGGPYNFIPLRLAASRLFYSAIGQAALKRLTLSATRLPLRLLTDEYFISVRKPAKRAAG